MALPTQEELENAQLDITTISEFVNNAASVGGGNVTNRTGDTFRNLARINEDIATAGIVSFERVTVDSSGDSDVAYFRARSDATFRSGYQIYDRIAFSYRNVVSVSGNGTLEFGDDDWGSQSFVGDIDFSGNFGANITGNPLSASTATSSVVWNPSPGRLAVATIDSAGIVVNRTSDSSPDGPLLQWRANGTLIAGVSVSGSTIAYNTTSDYRLKDERDAPSNYDPIAKVEDLGNAMRWYSWSNAEGADDPSGDARPIELGWYAHELRDIVPSAVTGEKDHEENGEIIPQGRDDTKLIPDLVAAMHALILQNRDLQERVEQLEAGA